MKNQPTQDLRYFIVNIRIINPWCSNPKLWQPIEHEVLLFDEPFFPSHDFIINACNEAWTSIRQYEIVKINEVSREDFYSFMGDEKDWTDKSYNEAIAEMQEKRRAEHIYQKAVENSRGVKRQTPKLRVL